MSQHTVGADEEATIELTPSIISCYPMSAMAPAESEIECQVLTAMVGQGARIRVTGKINGSRCSTVNGRIYGNLFSAQIAIPEDVEFGDEFTFDVELPGNDCDDESTPIPCTPAVTVSNRRWSQETARRGDLLTLTGDVAGLRTGMDVEIVIYEYDTDELHDELIALPARIDDGSFEVSWEFDYVEETDRIHTEEQLSEAGRNYSPPEFFFAVRVGGVEFGSEQPEPRLEFQDWIELALRDGANLPIPGQAYRITTADGNVIEGELDDQGLAVVEDIPPGPYGVEYPDLIDEVEFDEEPDEESSESSTDEQSNDQSEDEAPPAEEDDLDLDDEDEAEAEDVSDDDEEDEDDDSEFPLDELPLDDLPTGDLPSGSPPQNPLG